MFRKEYQNLIQLLDFKERGFSLRNRQGTAASSRKGRGVDFKDVRPYAVGDDTRLIDWNVTSRFGELHVREFYEEKERLGVFFLDVSESMDWSSSEWTKAENAFQVLALLVLLYIRKGNLVKILLYSDRLEWETGYIRNTEEALSSLEKVRCYPHRKLKTDPKLPFVLLKNKIRRYTDSYILSDFHGLPSLKKLTGLRRFHTLHAIRFKDRLEENAPGGFFQFFLLKDPETGATPSPVGGSIKKNLEFLFKSRCLELEGKDTDPNKLLEYWRRMS
ncbi:DUF58 domain-containing protein [Leptospira licerasiae]|uniref:PF01882 family protein n=1 Tax=Leptospira licerasiae str. MMD4847 TaxID=1049971 RepID=A0ABN0HDP1_9LEPT|nr:DUF58 domain-containing protein [Leptospira licerasiae]EIE01030.1 hypothetical protein LEP1GSC185_3744 [Leptospira licerasiae serovar Varillal str. VAR 010]EJZ43756.1 PF01882 family protein [Leptospira licerasiae str. MMD4847]